MKRILINGAKEELRVALVSGQTLYDLDIERPGKEQKKASIYKGIVTHVEASLEAAFVDYGAERHGFLPLKEVSLEYFPDSIDTSDENNITIKNALKEGQEVLVQVEKEERGTKGAALSTYITLAGCYLVLMPNNPSAGGISRRIEGDERNELKELIESLEMPEQMGLIVRTAGEGKSRDELEWDLGVLLKQWEAIQAAFKETQAPCLIYQESDVIIRTIRDYLRKDIGEVLIDNPDLYNRAIDHVRHVRPNFTDRIKLYRERIPLFSRYQIESQIESAFQRCVRLPSGGEIVIDHTEALLSVDINSSKATKGGDIEETALQTNLEAADEIARQLRLRDLGGLVVIDFIDMTPSKNQREVELRLRDALKADRARVQVGRISRFGLLEMSRQRLRPALSEAVQRACPRCFGQGSIRSIESLGLSILRLIEENAIKPATAMVQVQLPISVATFLMNEKRNVIIGIESRLDVIVQLIPNPYIETPDYKLRRLKEEELPKGGGGKRQASYEQTYRPDVEAAPTSSEETQSEIPAVAHVVPDTPNPGQGRPVQTAAQDSFLKRLISMLFGAKHAPIESDRAESSSRQPQRRQNQQRNRKSGPGNGNKTRSKARTSNRNSNNSGDADQAQQNNDSNANNSNNRSDNRKTNAKAKTKTGANRHQRNRRQAPKKASAQPEVDTTTTADHIEHTSSKPSNVVALEDKKQQQPTAVTENHATESQQTIVEKKPEADKPAVSEAPKAVNGDSQEPSTATTTAAEGAQSSTADATNDSETPKRRSRRGGRKRRGHLRSQVKDES